MARGLLPNLFVLQPLDCTSLTRVCSVRFLPSWFPGAGFKRKAARWGRQLYDQSLEPHEYVKRQLVSIITLY